jgi:uncharacterized SAM-binding protein YcdF (DUF218 family)
VERRRLPLLRFLFVACVAAVILFLSAPWWLRAIGNALVEDDGPAKADLGVVLGGDYWGNRIEKAAQLIQQGYIPQALVSGPPGFYGHHESDLAISYIVGKGYPAAWFIGLPHNALSTETEARVLLAELRRRNVRSYLLITSDYHTHRAAREFRHVARSMGYEPAVRAVASYGSLFRMDRWWKEREGQKAVFFEWTKTLAFAVGL